MSFGEWPDVSLGQAREVHSEARRLLLAGNDPMAANRRQTTTGDDFKMVAEDWHAHWKVGKSKQHADSVMRRLEANVFPAIGDLPVTAINTPRIVAMVKEIEARGVYDLAKRCLQTTGQIFRYAIVHSKAATNPASAIKPRDALKTVPKKNLARIDPADVGKLMRDIETYSGANITRLAVKLMAHVFVRTTELIGGEWPEVDFTAARWNIPAERMKMKRPHIVPLSRQSILILRILHSITGKGTFMFPGEQGADTMSNNTILQALDRMGYKYDMTGHGFRGLASTILNDNDFDERHIEMQLAHAKKNQVSAAYNHAKYLRQRTEMMQWYSDYLDSKMNE